jgi:hypothetical protein
VILNAPIFVQREANEVEREEHRKRLEATLLESSVD